MTRPWRLSCTPDRRVTLTPSGRHPIFDFALNAGLENFLVNLRAPQKKRLAQPELLKNQARPTARLATKVSRIYQSQCQWSELLRRNLLMRRRLSAQVSASKPLVDGIGLIQPVGPGLHCPALRHGDGVVVGASKGPCKGYVIDHIQALARGGADAPNNMQWQTVDEAKLKDKWERRGCRRDCR